ncbi:MAG: tRNA threonylcarbamoyladenosine dehydratase [Paludibacteraceae bacterium]|nr:tRNA threonylcarbamoyladenosine dehydratase [Paludibacteraceae bacterium]
MTYNKDIFQRTELLLGEPCVARIASVRVILFGVGGVGSWCAETLVRSGIHHLTIVDGDVVVPSNINRQLMATTATLGLPKVEVLRERLLSINPDAQITAINGRFNAGTADCFHLDEYDFIIDAIDSLTDKALLINTATRMPNAQLFSSMGAARKLDPTKIRIADFRKVTGDPLARTLRQKFKHMELFPERKFLCVYSDEALPNAQQSADSTDGSPRPNGTVAHITAIFGHMLASLVLNNCIS